ncbi:MAG: YheC/YheD family protein [Tepidibacillus sp.]
MNSSHYAWVRVSSIKPWKLILPHYNQTAKISSMAYTIGHNNQSKSFIISSKKNVSDLRGAFPVRVIKKNLQYKIGPIVGILTTSGFKTFRGNRKNFIDIIQTGIKTGVLVYVFTPESIEQGSKTVKAHLYYPEQKKWDSVSMPLPDVVYNRIPTRREERLPIVQQTIQFLETEGIPFFNPHFFNKWSLYQWMGESHELAPILPDTAILERTRLQNLLKKYQMLYLKPIHGKAGIGFMKVQKKDNLFNLTYQAQQITYHQQFVDFNHLWKKVKKLANNKEYIIQQGIHLSTYQGRPYDIRVLVQKNGKGQWHMTGMGIRVAGEQSITTHVPQGGYIQSVDTVFHETFGNELTEKWKHKTALLTTKIAQHIEKKVGHSLGEMSMDLGIDKNGDIWFFEANAKPMEFDEPNIRQTSLLRLLQYFRYLSGFVPKEVKS